MSAEQGGRSAENDAALSRAWISTSERAAVERVLSGLIEWPEPGASETLRRAARERLAEAMSSIERIIEAGTSVIPPVSTAPERDRAAEVEAAEDRAEQAAYDAARERS